MICASWRWAGEEKVHSVSVLDDPKRFKRDPSDDRYVIETLHKVLSEADVLVGHNSDSFDKRYLDTRILVHGLDPLPPIPSIDTCKIAKSKFYFNSGKLDYLGKLLKVGQKIDTTPGLWMRVLNGEKAAIREMVVYNQEDVRLLERVFNKLRPFIPNHINRQLFDRGEGCPRCGSHKIQSRGTHKAITRIYQRWFCNACRGWFRTLRAEKNSTTKFQML